MNTFLERLHERRLNEHSEESQRTSLIESLLGGLRQETFDWKFRSQAFAGRLTSRLIGHLIAIESMASNRMKLQGTATFMANSCEHLNKRRNYIQILAKHGLFVNQPPVEATRCTGR